MRRCRFEVIVVDDGGPDYLEPVLAEFRDRLQLRLITQANRGPGAARNAGAAVANGRLLVFIDDDCVPAERWLSALVRVLETHPDRLLGGPVLNALPDNPYSTSSQLIATYVSEYYAKGRANERFFTTNNFALSAERFRELEWVRHVDSECHGGGRGVLRPLARPWLRNGLGTRCGRPPCPRPDALGVPRDSTITTAADFSTSASCAGGAGLAASCRSDSLST